MFLEEVPPDVLPPLLPVVCVVVGAGVADEDGLPWGGARMYRHRCRRWLRSIGTPLIEMLKNLRKHKNGKKIGLTWNASANEAFLKLKHAITDIVPLQLADWDEDFVLNPDAGNWAVGVALQQEGPDGALRPLAFSLP